MKEVLDKVRLEYRDEYEMFINKMERETDEVRMVMVVIMVMVDGGDGGVDDGDGGHD